MSIREHLICRSKTIYGEIDALILVAEIIGKYVLLSHCKLCDLKNAIYEPKPIPIEWIETEVAIDSAILDILSKYDIDIRDIGDYESLENFSQHFKYRLLREYCLENSIKGHWTETSTSTQYYIYQHGIKDGIPVIDSENPLKLKYTGKRSISYYDLRKDMESSSLKPWSRHQMSEFLEWTSKNSTYIDEKIQSIFSEMYSKDELLSLINELDIRITSEIVEPLDDKYTWTKLSDIRENVIGAYAKAKNQMKCREVLL